MTGRRIRVPGGRPMLRAVAEALPGQSLTVFLALIAAGALALTATAFGGWSATPAKAAEAQSPANVHAGHLQAPSDDGLFTSASPEPSPPVPDSATARSIPLTAADKLLLVKVRQADLWEIPTGQQAQQKATSSIVKQVGATLAANHQALDKIVLQLGAELNVTLPNTPNAQQQGWLADLAAKTGPAYDQAFADHLRYAHGLVFNIISQVRTGTHNPLIRAFAQTANTIVMRHMTLLESTGLVDYGQLPAPVVSQAAVTTSSATAANQMPGMRSVLIVAMLAAAALIGTISIRRVRRGQ
jgi:predicted outer membrane protein